jgi:hypothetical protein
MTLRRYAVVATDRNGWQEPRIIKYTLTAWGAERERRYYAGLARLLRNTREDWTVERVVL